ncbi:MAG TPA: CarD family transcriptional regulator [Anaerolineales bacterium]|nr:CarD family transcriptional regulator [Anaerolineales bacterium]
MPFQVDDQVVHPACGIGRVVGVVTKRFPEAEARQYYEIAIPQGTVWAPVDSDAASGLRPLTPQADLGRYRGVLRSRPAPLTSDARQRRLELLSRLKAGSFQTLCEVVRDLTAHGWRKALRDVDTALLKKAREELCQEWAAADGVSVSQATDQVDALLGEARQTYDAPGR